MMFLRCKPRGCVAIRSSRTKKAEAVLLRLARRPEESLTNQWRSPGSRSWSLCAWTAFMPAAETVQPSLLSAKHFRHGTARTSVKYGMNKATIRAPILSRFNQAASSDSCLSGELLLKPLAQAILDPSSEVLKTSCRRAFDRTSFVCNGCDEPTALRILSPGSRNSQSENTGNINVSLERCSCRAHLKVNKLNKPDMQHSCK